MGREMTHPELLEGLGDAAESLLVGWPRAQKPAVSDSGKRQRGRVEKETDPWRWGRA